MAEKKLLLKIKEKFKKNNMIIKIIMIIIVILLFLTYSFYALSLSEKELEKHKYIHVNGEQENLNDVNDLLKKDMRVNEHEESIDSESNEERISKQESYSYEKAQIDNNMYSEIVKEATCTNKGKKIKECVHCNKVLETKEIDSEHYYQNCICKYCRNVEYIDDRNKTLILDPMNYVYLKLQTSGSITIPEKVIYNNEEYTVVGLGDSLFDGNKDISSVKLPNTINYIGKFAFNNCTNLKNINLPEGLIYIGKAAFQCCYQLEEIKIPSSVEYIGNFAYNHNSSVQNKTIVLPSSLKKMGDDIHYPTHMFYDCGNDSSFKEFIVEGGNQYYKAVDGILYTSDCKTLVAIPIGKNFSDNTYIMPDTVTNLGELSFSRNPHIKNVVLSDNLKVDGQMKNNELKTYLNNGNDLSIAIYQYCHVQNYYVKSTNKNYQSIDGILYSKNAQDLVAIPTFYNGDIDIPNGTVNWNSEALWNSNYSVDSCFKDIKNINIPSSMRNIDSKQLQLLNTLVDKNETSINISLENPKYYVKNGHILVKE